MTRRRRRKTDEWESNRQRVRGAVGAAHVCSVVGIFWGESERKLLSLLTSAAASAFCIGTHAHAQEPAFSHLLPNPQQISILMHTLTEGRDKRQCLFLMIYCLLNLLLLYCCDGYPMSVNEKQEK